MSGASNYVAGYVGSAQTITNAVDTLVNFTFDSASSRMRNSSDITYSNNVFVCNTPAVWTISYQLGFPAADGGIRVIYFSKNGTQNGTNRLGQQIMGYVLGDATYLQSSVSIPMNVGDSIRFYCYHTFTSSLTINSGNYGGVTAPYQTRVSIMYQ